MRFGRRLLLMVLLSALLACVPATSTHAPISAIDAAQTIFDRITSLHIDGLPNDAQMRELRPWLSTELAQALDAARNWQREEIARMQRAGSEDKPPFIEGDLFSSLFEGAQSARAVSVRVHDAYSYVDLDRGYRDADQTLKWQDRAILIKSDAGYLLDDVEYGGQWAFQAGNASLRETLKARE